MTTSTIRATLERVGAITPERVEQFPPRTRDREVPVWLDPVSGVFFIDNYYVGDHEYF